MKRVAALIMAAGIGLGGVAVGAPAWAASTDTVHATANASAALINKPIVPASLSCETWFDSNTFGAACGGYPGHYYRAVAHCKNGSYAYGYGQYGTSWRWSYAYCTSVYSSLDYGFIQFS